VRPSSDPANRVKMRTYYAQYYQTNRERILTQSRARWLSLRRAPAVSFAYGRVLVHFD
jgi:hypothetical protein